MEQALPEVDGAVEVVVYKGMAMESAYCSRGSTRCCRQLQVWRPWHGEVAARESNNSCVGRSALNTSNSGKSKPVDVEKNPRAQKT